MSRVTTDRLLAGLSDLVAAQTGLNFPPSAWRDLERGAEAAAAELRLGSVEALVRALRDGGAASRQAQVLARHLTIGETYFFREKGALEALESRILPELISSRRTASRELRIWSAACCTGEEPYTIAIIVSQLLPDLKDWHITILGTDVNTEFLKVAASATYREWSFRATPPAIKERYFTPAAEKFALNREIKEMVTFAPLNLATDPYPSHSPDTIGMDVIFCRNALMYFTPESAARAIRGFHEALVPGGWLVVSPIEASPRLFKQFEPVVDRDVVLYRKAGPSSDDRRGPAADDGRWTIDDGVVEPVALPPSSIVHPSQAQDPSSGVALSPSSIIHRPSSGQRPAQAQGASSRWERAKGLYWEGRPSEAKAELMSLVEADANRDRVFTLLARIEADRGDIAAAIEWCDRAASVDRLNPDQWYLRALLLQEQGAVADAVKTFKRVLYLDPTFALAHFALGNLTMRQGAHAAARKHWGSARELLRRCAPDEPLSDVADVTAGQLDEIVKAALDAGAGREGP